MSRFEPAAPTHTGETSGRDSSTGMAWAFESPEQHWADHDRRQMRYWRTCFAQDRLTQAAEYRRRRDGDVVEPSEWKWSFLPAGEQ